MGIFSRLSDIINSNINALLDKAEDPEKILRLMVQEMEDTLVELRTTAAKNIAQRKDRERFMLRLQADIADWGNKAELALSKDREDLAKSALVHRRNLQEQADAVAGEILLISDQLQTMSDDTAKLQAKLMDVKNRQRTILLRHAHAENTLRARTHTSDQRMDSILQRFDYAERRVDGLEAQAETLAWGQQRSLSHQIAALETDERIRSELDALKRKMRLPLSPNATPDGFAPEAVPASQAPVPAAAVKGDTQGGV